MKTIRRVLLAIFLAVALLSALPAAADYYFDRAAIYWLPELPYGVPAMWDEATDRFLSLYNQPGLWLARCTTHACQNEPVDPDATEIQNAYLFRQEEGLVAIYGLTSGEIRIAAEGEDGWTASPLELPIPGSDLIAVAQNGADALALICQDAAYAMLYAWQVEGEWQAEYPDWPEGAYGHSLTFSPDGVAHAAAQGLHLWRTAEGAWDSESYGDACRCHNPKIVAAGDGTLYAAEANGNSDPSFAAIFACRREAGGWVEIPGVGNWHKAGRRGPESDRWWLTLDGMTTDENNQLNFVYSDIYYTDTLLNHYSWRVCAYPDGWCPVMGNNNYGVASGSPRGSLAVDHGYRLAAWEAPLGSVQHIDYYFAGGANPIRAANIFADGAPLAVAARPFAGGLQPFAELESEYPGYPSGPQRIFARSTTGWYLFADLGHPLFYNTDSAPLGLASDGVLLLGNNNTYDDLRLFQYDFQGALWNSYTISNESLLSGKIAAEGGDLLLAWFGFGATTAATVYFSRRAPGAAPGAPAVVYDQGYAFTEHSVAVAACPDGLARVAYIDNGTVFLATEGESFDIETVDDSHAADSHVGISCDPDNVVHVFFSAADGLYHSTPADKDWTVENLGAGLEMLDAVTGPDGGPYVAAHRAEPRQSVLLHLTGDGWTSETLADAPQFKQMALWANDTDLLVCYFPSMEMECRSTAPILGEDIDDDTVDDDTVPDDDIVDDDTTDDDSVPDDDIVDDDTTDDDSVPDDDAVDDDTTDDDSVPDDDAVDDDTADDDSVPDDDAVDDDNTDDDFDDDATDDDVSPSDDDDDSADDDATPAPHHHHDHHHSGGCG